MKISAVCDLRAKAMRNFKKKGQKEKKKDEQKRMTVYLFVGGVGIIAADVADPGLDFVVLEVLLECLLYTPR